MPSPPETPQPAWDDTPWRESTAANLAAVEWAFDPAGEAAGGVSTSEFFGEFPWSPAEPT